MNEGNRVIGIDNLSNYYDPSLKKSRNEILSNFENFSFFNHDISNYEKIYEVFDETKPTYVIHLAAQAGVRYSLINPKSYIDSNIVGSFNILELSKIFKINHLIMASTSSIYGLNKNLPFKEIDKADTQLNAYSASKKSISLSYAYSYIHNLPITILRFFTVYGP